MNIVLVQHKSFLNGSGGAEKMCSFLANGFLTMGHVVTIATNEDIAGKPMFQLATGIHVENIFDASIEQVVLKPILDYRGKNPLKWIVGKVNKKIAKFHNARLTKKYAGNVDLFNLKQRSAAWKAYLEVVEPDVVVTVSLAAALEITYENRYSFPIVNTVNGRPDYDYMPVFGARDPLEMSLLTDTFKKLSAVQILFESYKAFIPKTFTGKVFVIPNPVPQTTSLDIVNHQVHKVRYQVINIARLDNDCKQQSIAIAVFSELAGEFPDWDLVFWGLGPDRQFLQDRIDASGQADRIFIKGFTADPLLELKKSDIFIFPSKYEGFGLALAEAMSIGLPVLGLSSCSGVNELIRHGRNGYLAANYVEMKEYLCKLMRSAELRGKMGLAASDDMKQYDSGLILSKWNELLNSIMSLKTIN